MPGWPDLKGFPLSFATKADGVVYASGLTGMAMPTMKLVPGGIAAETTQALHNLQELLAAAGGSLEGVVGCSVMLLDITRDFKAMNEAYAKFWPKDPPSRVAVQVGALAGNSSVEIKCTAVLPGKERDVVDVPGWPKMPGFPLSFVVRAGGMVYASGMQGLDLKTMKLVPGGAAAELRQTMENIETMLQAAGTSLDNAVGCEISLRDLADVKAVNDVYKTFWHAGRFASRIAVKVAGLAGNASVEVRCTAAAAGTPTQVIKVPAWGRLSVPAALAVAAGKTVYVSGMAGIDFKDGKLVPGGIVNETQKALENLKTILEAANAKIEDVMECEVNLRTMQDFKALNAAYSTFWPKDAPARAAVQVGGLQDGSSVEIKCTGIVDEAKETAEFVV